MFAVSVVMAIFISFIFLLFSAFCVIGCVMNMKGISPVIMDGLGFTLYGKIGPIPWDCIIRADIGVGKAHGSCLFLMVENLPMMKTVLGEEIVRKKVKTERRSGDSYIRFDVSMLQTCRFNIANSIDEYATKQKTRNSRE